MVSKPREAFLSSGFRMGDRPYRKVGEDLNGSGLPGQLVSTSVQHLILGNRSYQYSAYAQQRAM